MDIKAKPDNHPLSFDDIELDLDELALNPEGFQIAAAPGDTSSEMLSKVRAFAFPALEKLIYENLETIPPSDEIKSAVLEDLKPLIEYHWRAAQLKRRTDPEAEILKKMRVTRRLPYMDIPEEQDFD